MIALTVTLFAMPGYWLGLMLVMLFTYWARLLPSLTLAMVAIRSAR